MTPQEQQMLQGLTDRIDQTSLPEKDPDAEQYLQRTLGRNPDALYILAQTVLVQQYALDQAQKQLADAKADLDELRQQSQSPQPKHSSSFLGNLLGLSDDAPRQAPQPPPPAYTQPAYAPVSYQAPPYGGNAPGYGTPPQSGGFLRSALQTATGVAAGALAFQGIESLMHGFGHSGGQGFSDSRPEEVVNNYYGGAASGEHAEHLSPDIDDRRNESSSFSDAVTNNDHHDGTQSFMDNDTSDASAGFENSAEDSSDDGGSGDTDDTNY